MAYFRRLGVIGVLGACFFIAAGCGDDEDKTTPDGEAGEAGESNATAGKGGKTTAGSAGSATGGAAGNAGSSTEGGAAGEGGTGGGGGEPQVGGGAGDGGTATSGGAGAGGASGDAGAAGSAPTATFCANPCEVDEDCAVGEDTSTTCNQATHRCEPPGESCESDETCVAALNFLWFPCGEENACDEGTVCVEVNGSGFCAPLGPDCFPSTLTLPLAGGQGATADVCGFPGRCGSNNRCFMSCVAFGCGEAGATCDAESGRCSCTAPNQCPSLGYANAPEVCE